MKLVDEVELLPVEYLSSYIQKRARIIVEATQEDNWDDPEEWTCEAVEMAHALFRMNRDGVTNK